MITASTITVPRSGWSSTRPMGTLARAMIVVRRHASSSPRYWLQYAANATMIPNLASSDGWTVNPPGSWNHAWWPLMLEPTGASTASSSTTVAP